MNRDSVSGAARQVKGSIKEAIGKLTGDTKTQAAGAVEKAGGRTQNIVGGSKDTPET